MSQIEIKAPAFPESVAEGTLVTWHHQPGEQVARDTPLADVETEKVVLEIMAPAAGKIKKIVKQEGEVVFAEELLGYFSAEKGEPVATSKEAPVVVAASKADVLASPAARQLAEAKHIDLTTIKGTGKDGRVTKEDVLDTTAAQQGARAGATTTETVPPPAAAVDLAPQGERLERRVPMTRLRASIAKRLVSAQQNAAMLTTFNEVDMTAIMDLRSRYKDEFAQTHDGVRLGFMSFFVRASVEALQKFPAVNASIDGQDIVYHNYCDVGIAVGTDRGLVVPILRDAEHKSIADIEAQVRDFGAKAQQGKLSLEEMQGGTFTISNGGVYGSLLSTPILNPPQTAILGMHKIQERPIAVNGEVQIAPLMYLALSYDHRLIDGSEAVRFLVTIKHSLEDPARMLLAL